MEASNLQLLVTLLVSLFVAYRLILKKNNLPLPPGPKGWPLVGTTLPEYSWRQLEKWTKEYGTVFD
jgi:hypothetical protein